jgi:hypothetical protein
MIRASRALAALLLVALPGVVTALPAGAKPSKVQTTKFHVSLTSQATTLFQVGRGGNITYGWVHLAGTATSDSGDIGVDLLGNVQYTNGVGANFGFVTLHFASLSDVGFRFEGKATKGSEGVTDFSAKMKVIGGNAALTGVKGTGSFTGSRAGELGSPVELDVVIRLRGIEIGEEARRVHVRSW